MADLSPSSEIKRRLASFDDGVMESGREAILDGLAEARLALQAVVGSRCEIETLIGERSVPYDGILVWNPENSRRFDFYWNSDESLWFVELADDRGDSVCSPLGFESIGLALVPIAVAFLTDASNLEEVPVELTDVV